jgi:hypothetical protein
MIETKSTEFLLKFLKYLPFRTPDVNRFPNLKSQAYATAPGSATQ